MTEGKLIEAKFIGGKLIEGKLIGRKLIHRRKTDRKKIDETGENSPMYNVHAVHFWSTYISVQKENVNLSFDALSFALSFSLSFALSFALKEMQTNGQKPTSVPEPVNWFLSNH